MNMQGKRMSLLLAVSLCSFGATNKLLVVEEKEHNRCRQHRFGHFSDWSRPVNLGSSINTQYSEFHMAISADEMSLFFSSDRPGGLGGNDLWVAHRVSTEDDWEPAQNLGPTLNTSGGEACVALSPDEHRLFFCSNGRGGFGGFDIFVSFRKDTSDNFGWEEPVNLGEGVNSEFDDGDETFFLNPQTGVLTLYFASNRPGGGIDDWDIYMSTEREDSTFNRAVLVPELSSPRRDAHPTITCDGLEIFLASNRPGSYGGIDLWVSMRRTTHDAWSTPVNLGPVVNTLDDERAPYLSADAQRLYFTSNRPGGFGGNDFYVTTRTLCDDNVTSGDGHACNKN